MGNVYVLTEDGSQLGDFLKDAATDFKAIHADDAVVKIFVRQNDPRSFENARIAFDVRRIPAVAISDEEHQFGSAERVTRYLALDRGLLERYVIRRSDFTIDNKGTQDAFYNLLADFHYIVVDEGLLRLKMAVTGDRIASFLKVTWNEIRDLVSINVSPL